MRKQNEAAVQNASISASYDYDNMPRPLTRIVRNHLALLCVHYPDDPELALADLEENDRGEKKEGQRLKYAKEDELTGDVRAKVPKDQPIHKLATE